MSIPPEPPLSAPLFSDFSIPPSFLAELTGLLSLARVGSSLYELEGMLRKLVASFARLMLDALAEVLRERDLSFARPRCPRCRDPMNRNRPEARILHLLEGELELWRTYWECRPCKQYLHPLDLDLDLPRDGEVAPRFGHDLCLLGVELPYKTGARLLEALTGREVDGGTIRNQVLREGGALLELEKREAEIYSAPLRPRERARQLAELPDLHSPPVPGKYLLCEIDGVMNNVGADAAVKAEIQAWEERKRTWEEEQRKKKAPVRRKAGTREQGGKMEALPFEETKPSRFRETLNARFYRLEDLVRTETKSGKVRSELTRSETVSVVNDPTLFLKRIYATSEVWKAAKYQWVVALGDGAVFERDLADCLRPDYEILDFQHAKSHVYECGRALFGEGTKEARGWGKRGSDSLFENGPEPLLKVLELELDKWRQREAEGGEPPPKKLVNLQAYVTRHRMRMRYPLFRKLGLPIATGAIESANRQVNGDRCKRSGMGWSRSSLQCLLGLRAALLSNNWERACAAIREQRSCRPTLEPELEIRPPVNVLPLEPLNPGPCFGEQASEKEAARSRPRRRPLFSERTQARKLHSGLLRRTEDGVVIASVAA